MVLDIFLALLIPITVFPQLTKVDFICEAQLNLFLHFLEHYILEMLRWIFHSRECPQRHRGFFGIEVVLDMFCHEINALLHEVVLWKP